MRRWMAWLMVFLLLSRSLLAGAEGSFVVMDDEDGPPPDSRRQARALMQGMTAEEKICQLFFVTLEDLTGEERSTAFTEDHLLSRYPVGGVLLFGQNIVSESQLKLLTDALRTQAARQGLFPLFIGVDEEGGSVSRIANKLGYPLAPSPREIGDQGDGSLARAAGEQIAAYLAPLGVNMTFAPPADTMADEAEAGVQAYGTDPDLVSRMALSMAEGLKSGGILPCFTHFPGHGEKTGNTSARLSIRRSLAEMAIQEFVPFEAAIQNGADMILVSHAIVRALGDDMPASTSSMVIGGILRAQLGYDGVVVSDSLRMSAVTSAYKKGQEAVAALKAGADILLLPPDLDAALSAVRRAVDTGEIPLSRIEDSVERVLAVKIRMGWIR